MGDDSGDFWMAGDWFKVILSDPFRKVTEVSFTIIRDIYKNNPSISWIQFCLCGSWEFSSALLLVIHFGNGYGH